MTGLTEWKWKTRVDNAEDNIEGSFAVNSIVYISSIPNTGPAASSFEVEWLKCRIGLGSLARTVQKFFSLSFSKGVRNHSHGVFVNQYWKCSHACRSVLEVLSVCRAGRSRPRVVDLVSLSTATLHLGNVSRKPFLVSVRIVSSGSTALTTTMLTWIKLSEVHTYLGLKISPFFRGGPKSGAAMMPAL